LRGRSVGGSVGWLVDWSVGCIFFLFVCLINLCSSENTARLLAGGLNLMCINKYILYVLYTLFSKYLIDTKITVARIIFKSLELSVVSRFHSNSIKCRGIDGWAKRALPIKRKLS